MRKRSCTVLKELHQASRSTREEAALAKLSSVDSFRNICCAEAKLLSLLRLIFDTSFSASQGGKLSTRPSHDRVKDTRNGLESSNRAAKTFSARSWSLSGQIRARTSAAQAKRRGLTVPSVNWSFCCSHVVSQSAPSRLTHRVSRYQDRRHIRAAKTGSTFPRTEYMSKSPYLLISKTWPSNNQKKKKKPKPNNKPQKNGTLALSGRTFARRKLSAD